MNTKLSETQLMACTMLYRKEETQDFRVPFMSLPTDHHKLKRRSGALTMKLPRMRLKAKMMTVEVLRENKLTMPAKNKKIRMLLPNNNPNPELGMSTSIIEQETSSVTTSVVLSAINSIEDDVRSTYHERNQLQQFCNRSHSCYYLQHSPHFPIDQAVKEPQMN
ncbi:hypothetical protein D5086_019921 [Populus alba]|uniref:Uncharacterized protein n=1 Tax=Populus alba TaxID=43335 RepID=A0ACC4BJ87_POPAL